MEVYSLVEQKKKLNKGTNLDQEKLDYESLLYAGVDEVFSIIRPGLQVLG